jgi:2-keto-4-pentenoate hydratase/2-oxohepta-3-ene-1,7-dioic acid hydratase in catechol pathway
MVLSATDFLKKHYSGKIFDALAFEQHMRQIRGKRNDTVPPEWYERVTGYWGHIEKDKIKGNGDIILYPSFEQKKDYEFEIVGMCLESIKTTNVHEAIEFMKQNMVFTIWNDTSCREFQAYDMKLPLSVAFSKGMADKSFGPKWVPGKDLHMDNNGIFYNDMQLSVNGRIPWDCLTSDNFKSIYFTDPKTGASRAWGFAQIIAWFGRINQGFEAGDLIGSGTIGNGSIADALPQREWLKEGDIIRMWVSGIGTLTNTVGVIEMPDPRNY